MQSIYEKILTAEPGNVRALKGKAAALAWQGDYAASQSTYRRAIAMAPGDVNAKVDLGYAYAWAGQYTDAHNWFNRALNDDPMHVGARKGVGYAYLWAGEYELALESFDLAASIAPDDAEIGEAAGHANLSLGHARDAIASYDRSLWVDPDRESAKLARHAAYTTAPILETSAQYGSTSGIDSGVRSAEVAHWPTMTTRLALRYDDSLSLDNRTLAQRGQDAPGYYFNVQQSVGEKWIGSMELGQRQLVDGNQNMVSIAAVRHTGHGTLKLGAQLGRHDVGYTDELVHLGFDFPVADVWRIQPVLFVSRFGPEDDSEWRALVNAVYEPGPKWNAGLRFGGGDIDAFDPAFSGGTTIVGAWGSLYVSDQLSLNLALQREETPADTLDIALLGFTYRVPRN